MALGACCLVVWLSLAGALALLWVEWRLGTLHPVFWPFALLLLLALLAAIVALRLIAWRLERGWRDAWLWTAAIVLAGPLFAAPFVSALRAWSDRNVPHGHLGNVAMVAGATLMEAQAAYGYPRRLETERLTMFYHNLLAPAADAAAMERHVAELEAKLGRPLRAKIHWVRGSLIGQGNLSFLGLALGSAASPADWSGYESHLDRHELAHAVITQQRPVTADPPMLLHEGWAESQCGLSSEQLAQAALRQREMSPDLSLADLFGPDWYHRDSGPVYTYGGAGRLPDSAPRRRPIRRAVQ